ncbi:endonuclease domain-containing protein [Arthrobacter caoxuetaonis]|uniref:Endonuclease domain-containing protein n=1 Tax=Arthrobacter caoxuetaonis TaxID=2886935 RepID=A0A9X1MDA9_9MICC|nr:endonuclease domain-containing protein [Arthrobacter caoxuetaonis]MCC3297200.1 endonuclease domain-containing protein [Arthrobacter caoxuetaonis]USQ58243.1 endonuclease domain-containing protein [Arthrobacter caoxuetaonis]
MRTPRPLPHPLSDPFLVEQALSLGVTPGRLRGSDLRIPSRGIRVPKNTKTTGTPAELAASCRPYLELFPDAVLSHTTAARLHGIPLPPSYRNESFLHLTRPPNAASTTRRHIRSHRSRLEDFDVVQPAPGLRLTSEARTFADLARILDLPDLTAAGDWLVSEHGRSYGQVRHAVLGLEELRSYVNGLRWIPGIRTARRALDLVRVGVDSPPETYLRLMLHDAGLPEFRPNMPLLDAAGRPVLWTDLGCPEFRTCVEYDGAHHLTPKQQMKDHNRDLLVSELGWHQVKVSAVDMRRGSAWVAPIVARGLRLGGWVREQGVL